MPSLQINPNELCLSRTLQCGQSFRWRQLPSGRWTCAFPGRVIQLQQQGDQLHFYDFPRDSDVPSVEQFISSYFQLKINLSKLYSDWASADKHFHRISNEYIGIRVLKQDPWENLISFICSSNNNIKRISQMINNLCTQYGNSEGIVEGTEFFSFPTPSRLANDSIESELRKLGFGYRAKFVARAAKQIAFEQPADWFEELINSTYDHAHKQLQTIHGIGAKVADCICLMSLDKTEAVPVDTHVRAIAVRDYKLKQIDKGSLTERQYRRIAEFFRDLWGPYSGWAHTVLFAADLPALKQEEPVIGPVAVVLKTEDQVPRSKKRGLEK